MDQWAAVTHNINTAQTARTMIDLYNGTNSGKVIYINRISVSSESGSTANVNQWNLSFFTGRYSNTLTTLSSGAVGLFIPISVNNGLLPPQIMVGATNVLPASQTIIRRLIHVSSGLALVAASRTVADIASSLPTSLLWLWELKSNTQRLTLREGEGIAVVTTASVASTTCSLLIKFEVDDA